MSVKEAEVRVSKEKSYCRHCGHPKLVGASRLTGRDRLWFAYCPACFRIQEHLAIPGWFCDGLPEGDAAGGLN